MEWFKFRMSWRRPMQMLTDEEAGRLIKALMEFAFTEQEQSTDDRGDLLLCQMTEALRDDLALMKQKAEKKAALSRKRSEAGLKGAMAKHTKEKSNSKSESLPAAAEACRDLPEVAGVCHGLPGKNKSKEYKNKELRYTERRGEDSSSCSEPPSAVSELPTVEIPLNDGSMFPLFPSDLDEYRALYPAVDVAQELRSIRGWCLANETRRKTRRGVKRFINGWLSRAQDKGGKKPDTPHENPFLAYARGEKEFGDLVL